ncbi:hypothetical protein [Treponema endosymbiont of Eucomonympha sp.]|uniref:hypothetical protein n=1 Tax=Treponema endosymbiont of Eucomonympha sp. TaxID=1580831 RepID=UPI000782FA62|nr:hypothetical protein [Treponema endosymbiont of Eucomonympha sp.]
MATKQDIASSLSVFIRQNSLKPSIAQKIQEKLDELVYTETGVPVSVQDKLEIINEIDEDLQAPRVGELHFLTESENSEEVITLMRDIVAKYKE